ncbi:MAG: sigma-70 family RNA polymerase sigma factor [Gemmatimonadota bacterium]|jgi:RNA polymerase sigma-70 factor (ECF subfamily)
MSPLRHEGPARSRSDASDGALVRRVLAGDPDAYELLVRRYQDGLFRYARGLGVPPDAAEDLVQDALIRAYRYLRTCADSERFEVWVFRILRNAALDWLKDIRRRSVSVEDVVLHHGGPDPDEQAGRSELRDRLTRGLAELPTDLRDAFLMKHLEGLSYQEMQQVTGASLSALKMRVLRAREMLREILAEAAERIPM